MDDFQHNIQILKCLAQIDRLGTLNPAQYEGMFLPLEPEYSQKQFT